jgi:hypothetical protein
LKKEDVLMNQVKRFLLLLLGVSLVVGSLCSTGWAADKLRTDDPTVQGWSLIDLFVARPLGIVAGVGGTVVFVAALPFTIPSGSVGDSANMFIAQPFQFSFLREIPDPDL